MAGHFLIVRDFKGYPVSFAITNYAAMHRQLLLVIALLIAPMGYAQSHLIHPPSDPMASGGPLLPEQAAFDVRFYDLNLSILPEERRIAGSNIIHASIVLPTQWIAVDLDTTFTVTTVSDRRHPDPAVERIGGRLWMDYGRTLQPGESVELAVEYHGQPREAENPPWSAGFVWVDRPDGTHWISVANQGSGADIWWPVKDHQSDRPDSLRFAVTVPEGHQGISSGVLRHVEEHTDGSQTFEWFTSSPINNYGLSVYVGPFVTLDVDYVGVTGEPIPFSLHVLPEAREDALRQLPGFVDQFRFMEETFGPYPFRGDKYAVVHAPYLGMEHQTAIAYGDNWQNNDFGFDWLHLHELSHEWFGNMITVSDWSHFWVHEGFAMYVEALYAGHVGGIDEYLRYMWERMHHRIVNRQPIVPQPGLDSQSVYFGRADIGDQDVYFKGAWVLHTIRWAFRTKHGEVTGDDLFFQALRHITYPDPELEQQLGCASCRFVSTQDIRNSFEMFYGRSLEDLFALYLFQPQLPELLVTRENDTLQLEWNTPEGYTMTLPIEVEIDGQRQVVTFEEGRGVLPLNPNATVIPDPDRWILRSQMR